MVAAPKPPTPRTSRLALRTAAAVAAAALLATALLGASGAARQVLAGAGCVLLGLAIAPRRLPSWSALAPPLLLAAAWLCRGQAPVATGLTRGALVAFGACLAGAFQAAATELIGAFLLAFLAAPVFLAVRSGFREGEAWSLYWFTATLADRVNLAHLGNSLMLACATTLVSMVIALPPAVLRARTSFRGQGFLGVALLAPMILPPFVGALSMRRLFSQFGAVNLLLERIGVLDFSRALPPDYLGAGFGGVVALQSLHLFPILYLNASAALANIDPAYAQAARNLGASPWQAFWRITFPLMRPGLFAGGTIVFIWSLTDIGTPLILGYHRLTAVTIFKELAKSESTPAVYSLVLVMLGASVSLYALGKVLFGRGLAAETTKASIAAETHRLSPAGTVGAWAVFGVIILAALLPHAGVVLTAVAGKWVNTVLPSAYTLRHLAFVFQRSETVSSIVNSLKYAGTSTAVDLVVGCLAAWLIVRGRTRGRGLLDGLAMLPLAVPGLILAAGYVAMTAPGTALEPIGPTANPFVILVIAYSVRRLPFVVRGVAAGLQQVSPTLEEAARNLGASPARTAARITLPLVAANIIAAAVLSFSLAVLEVSDSLILAQTQAFYPITKEIYSQATSGNTDAANIAAALGVYGMVFLGGTLAVAAALLGRRLGAIFRA
ncbi:MAG: iron ABC transporter permease [Phycisphaerae bacterium]|nr:iron ABC transporter permease [Phycisphaerae bacterium]